MEVGSGTGSTTVCCDVLGGSSLGRREGGMEANGVGTFAFPPGLLYLRGAGAVREVPGRARLVTLGAALMGMGGKSAEEGAQAKMARRKRRRRGSRGAPFLSIQYVSLELGLACNT